MMRFMPKRWIMLLVSAAIALAAISLFSTSGAAQSGNAYPIDYRYLGELTTSSPIVLRLPQYITPRPGIASNGSFYGTGGLNYSPQNQLQGYSISIQADPAQCRQALICTEAYLEAIALDRSSPSIKEQFQIFYTPGFFANYHATAGHDPYQQTLSNSAAVTILPWTDGGSSAGYEKAVWDEWQEDGVGYRYIVALKMGDPANLIGMVESAFGSGSGSFDWDNLIEPSDPAQ